MDSLLLINIFFTTLFLVLLLFIYQLGLSKEQNIQLIEQSKQFELEEQQYQNILKSTEALRKMKHDIEIHLDVIQTLSENNESQKLKDYIQTYHNKLQQTHYLLSTGNTIIDCILSSKLLYAVQNGITMDYSVLVPEPFPLDLVAFSSLLGNLLDNAIEACQRYTDSNANKKSWILFYIKPYHNMVIIHSENTYNNIVKQRTDKSFISSKEDEGHGIGIKRIKSIVNGADRYY
ncbi:sensor histidine kinase [Anaerosporobacter sp.]